MRVIETSRLQLHPLDGRHERLFCTVYTDPALMRHVAAPLAAGEAPGSFRLACEQSASATHPAWWWAIHPKPGCEAVGVAGLTGSGRGPVEIGVMLLASAHDRGFATEALSALLPVAFSSLQASCVRARHAPANAAMVAVLRKLGFRPEGSCGATSSGWHFWCLDAPEVDGVRLGALFAKAAVGG
jgi:RimJ/RimL family protein N-acetyltransferase